MNVKVSIEDGATVTLSDVTINGVSLGKYIWARLTCSGDATIILEGTNPIKGFQSDYPAIYVPEGKTLTIKGDGSLTARSNGWGAGISAGAEMSCGNIVIEGGSITVYGGERAAAIGGTYLGSCGNITITDNVTQIYAITGKDAPYNIGAGEANICETVTIGVKVGAIPESLDPYMYPYVELPKITHDYTVRDGEQLTGKLGDRVKSLSLTELQLPSETEISIVRAVQGSSSSGPVSIAKVMQLSTSKVLIRLLA